MPVIGERNSDAYFGLDVPRPSLVVSRPARPRSANKATRIYRVFFDLTPALVIAPRAAAKPKPQRIVTRHRDAAGGQHEIEIISHECGAHSYHATALGPSGHHGASAQTYTGLFNFDAPLGALPNGLLAQGRDGNLYGTTVWGGTENWPCCGTVFKITPGGTLAVLHNFDGADGSGPENGLTLGRDGNLYGTTSGGGANNYGTIFKITGSGSLTTLYSFTGSTDNGSPEGPPIQGADGNFYGTTGADNIGTAYQITPSGVFALLGSLPGPSMASLVQGTDGNFYGTTEWGGSSNDCGNPINFTCGTVFKMTPKGIVTIVYSFDFTHGAYHRAPSFKVATGTSTGPPSKAALTVWASCSN